MVATTVNGDEEAPELPKTPVQILDSWIFHREEYATLLAKSIDGMTPQEEEKHIEVLDEALHDLDAAEIEVNHLFNQRGNL